MELGLGPPLPAWLLGGIPGGVASTAMSRPAPTLDELVGNPEQSVARAKPGAATDTPPDWAKRAADARQPRGGDWKERNQYLDRKDAEERLSNIENATFNNRPGGVAGGAMSGGAPVMISPGGWTPQSRTMQVNEGVKLSDDTKEKAVTAEESKLDAAMTARNAGKEAAEREMAYLRRFESLQEDHALRMHERAQAQRAQYEGELGKLQSMTAAVHADQIPTDHWFVKRDGDGKYNPAGTFAAALGYILGGISQGLLKLPENPVNMFIREQIAAQKFNANLRREKLEDQRSVLGQMSKAFGDERVAEEATWIAYLEKAKTGMARIAAESKDAEVQARYKAGVADINEQIYGHRLEWDKLQADRIARTQHDVNAPPMFAGGTAKKDSPDPLFVPTGPNGAGFRARTEKEAQAARGVVSAEQDVIPLLEELIEKREQSNFGERLAASKGVYESKTMAEIKSLQAQVALKLRELSASSPGAMDKGMQDLAGQIQGDWLSTTGNPEAAAKTFIRSIRRQKDSLQRGQAGQDHTQYLTRDAKGNIVTSDTGRASFSSPKAATPDSFKRAE